MEYAETFPSDSAKKKVHNFIQTLKKARENLRKWSHVNDDCAHLLLTLNEIEDTLAKKLPLEE